MTTKPYSLTGGFGNKSRSELLKRTSRNTENCVRKYFLALIHCGGDWQYFRRETISYTILEDCQLNNRARWWVKPTVIEMRMVLDVDV